MRLDAVDQGLGEAGRRAEALLVGVVERRAGAAPVSPELVEADGGIDGAAARQPQFLIVAGDGEKRSQTGRGVIEIADGVLLGIAIVVAIAVGPDRIAVERGRPGAGIERGRDVAELGVERAETGLDARGHRRTTDAIFGDDVDHAADRVVAVEHRAGIAARDLDPLDGIERDGGEIHLRHVDVVQPPAVDQHQRVGGGKGAEAAQVHAGLGADLAAIERRDLGARRLRRDDLRQCLRRRMRDIGGRDHGRGSADDAAIAGDSLRAGRARALACRRDIRRRP